MIVKRLELTDFRNYETLTIDFSEGTNILSGNNAQGKTNILEAIYLCGTTKSHKGAKEKEMIRFFQNEAHVRVYINRDGIDYKIDYHLSNSKKKAVAIDNVPVKKYSEIYALMNVVSFSPEDLSIIKNGPAERRHFCDMELCQLDKIYMFHLANYNKTLLQRNQMLKQYSPEMLTPELVSVWDEQLITNGEQVIRIRKSFVEEINEIAREIHYKLTDGKEKLTLVYEPNTEESEYANKLREGISRDIAAKMTLSGPHRDDICFLIEKEGVPQIDVRKFGSQGQQRSAALSLKLAEIEFVKRKVKNTPIILLDDVLSELDRTRQQQLIEGIDGMQTIITCTGLEEFVNCSAEYTKVFHVEAGKVTTVSKEA